MTTTAQTAATTQVFRVYIKATPEKVWQAITDPEWNGRYGYHAVSEYDLRAGGDYRVLANEQMRQFGSADVIITGEVLESDPPKRLVQTWHALFNEDTSSEPPTRLTWELEADEGLCRLTLTHELVDAPATAVLVTGSDATLNQGGGGWPLILSDLKTFLETGTSFEG